MTTEETAGACVRHQGAHDASCLDCRTAAAFKRGDPLPTSTSTDERADPFRRSMEATAMVRLLPDGTTLDPCPYCEGEPQAKSGWVHPCTPCSGTGVFTKPARDPETGERHGWNVCRYGGCDEPCGDYGGCKA
jgi:hypothetical protein